MKSKFKFKALFGLSFLTMPLIPLAIAASCGSSSSSDSKPKTDPKTDPTTDPKTDPKPETTYDVSFHALETSTHVYVKWSEITKNANVASVEFYFPASPTTLEAVSGPNINWIDDKSLPTIVNYDASTRSVWARIKPVEGAKIANPIVDLTEVSKIREIKTKINRHPTLSLGTQTIIKLLIDGGVEIIEPILPPGAKYRYEIPGEETLTFTDKDALRTYLLGLTQPYSTPVVLTKLDVTDPTKYTFDELIIPSANIVKDVIKQDNLSSADQAIIDAIKVDQTKSTHNAIIWGAKPTGLSNQIVQLSYSTNNYADAVAAESAPKEDWNTELPKTGFSFTHEERHLWVQVKTGENVILVNRFLDITVTSQIQKVVSLIDAIDGYTSLKLSSLVKATKNADFDYTITEQNLPAHTSVVYRVSGGGNFIDYNKASFEKWIKDTHPSDATVEATKIFLVVTNDTKYKISDDKQAFLFTRTLKQVDVSALISSVKYISGDSNNVKWSQGFNAGDAFTLPEGLKSVEFVVGDFSTKALAEKAYTDNKSSSLPTKVDWDKTKRKVWMFVKPLVGYEISGGEEWLDLTTSSGSARIIEHLDQLPSSAPSVLIGYQFYTDSDRADGNTNIGAKLDFVVSKTGFPYFVKDFSFSTKDYRTVDAAKNAPDTDWNTSTIFTFSFNPNERHIWARLNTLGGAIVDEIYFDLTDSSRAKELKSLIDALDGFSAFNLANAITVKKNSDFDYSLTEAQTPANTTIVYKVTGDAVGRNRADFETWIRTEKPSTSLIESVEASLVVTDTQKYALNDNKQAQLFRTGLQALNVKPFLDGITFLTGDSDTPKWTIGFNDGEAPTLLPGLRSLEFLVGNYPNIEAARLASKAKRTATLPSRLDFFYNQRFVWAFVKAANGFALESEVFNLTDSSRIQTAKGVVGANSIDSKAFGSFRGYDSRFIFGTKQNPIFDAGVAFPSFFEVKQYAIYSFVKRQTQERFNTVSELIAKLAVLGFDTADKINASGLGVMTTIKVKDLDHYTDISYNYGPIYQFDLTD